MSLSDDVQTAAILIIGNEILSGRTQDANTPWIAQKLSTLGIIVREVRVVPDEEPLIVQAIHALQNAVDYVFTTGGIGPTHDDITTASIAKAFGLDLALDPKAYDALTKHYGGESEMTPPRVKMAILPQGTVLIDNPVSAAPGFAVQNVYVLAGVPRIMQAMFDGIIPSLKKGPPVRTNSIGCSLRESVVADKLSAIQDLYPSVNIGSYPHFRGGILGLSLVLRAVDPDLLESATKEVIALIESFGVKPDAISFQSSGGERA